MVLFASISLGFAIATRYVGLGLLPPIVLCLLILGKKPIKKRFYDAFFLSFTACLPLGIWVIRNIIKADSATNREFVVHLIGLEQIKDTIVGLFNFLLPFEFNRWNKGVIFFIASIILLSMLIILIRKRGLKSIPLSIDTILPFLTFVSSISYITFVFLSKSFFDESIPIIDRLLLPMYIFLTISVFHFFLTFSQVLDKPYIWYIFLFFMSCSIVVNSIKTFDLAVKMHKNGIGYNSHIWNQSETLNLLKSFDDSRNIYSNGNDVIGFITGITAGKFHLNIIQTH